MHGWREISKSGTIKNDQRENAEVIRTRKKIGRTARDNNNGRGPHQERYGEEDSKPDGKTLVKDIQKVWTKMYVDIGQGKVEDVHSK